MSQQPFGTPGDQFVILLAFLAISSAAFGYVVGKNDRDSYLRKQAEVEQMEQKN